jgi:cytidylate kinase
MYMVLNIAMDGPVGAGKSSIAKAVADRLGILHLDTGAMYRAVGLSAIRAGVDLQDEAAVTAHTKRIDVAVAHSVTGQRTIVDGEDVTDYIRTPEVSMAASTVGKYAGVRREMVAIQQKLAASTPMLVDGRDICVRVLPNATVKLFLTASAEERARRGRIRVRGSALRVSSGYQGIAAGVYSRDRQPLRRGERRAQGGDPALRRQVQRNRLIIALRYYSIRSD